MSGGKTRKILLFLILATTITSSQRRGIGTFWIISDLHYDFTYGVQKEPESCRSVIPYTQLGKFGDYDCDTPWIMLNQTIYSMKQLAPDVDFILWTGDSVMHTRRDEALTLNKTVNIGMLRDITNLIKEAFPEVPLIPTVGNHDFFRDSQTSTAMLESMSKVFFNETELHTATFKKGGYFSANVSPRLRLLNLNTIYYYIRNENVNPTTNVDPAGQFDWLEKQLQLSKKGNKKVFITGHISPGFSPFGLMWFYSQYNQRFIYLVQQYADVINAMFFGHEHKSFFKIITTNGKGSVPVFIAPSVTPWTYTYNHNPAMWLVNYDREFVTLVNIEQYYVDLLQANRLQNLKYKLGYSIPSAYKMKNLTSESLLNFCERMKLDDALFLTYMKNMYANVTTKKQPEINLDLKIKVLCSMNSMDENIFGTCKARGIKPVNSSRSNVSINLIRLIVLIFTILALDIYW